MYLNFFSFAEKPFDITPDTRFLYRSPVHEEAIRTLLYGVHERRGFMVLTGEVGTGKTTSLRALLNHLEADRSDGPETEVETALILNPLLSTLDLIRSINRDFGIETVRREPTDSIQDQIEALNAFLLIRAREKKNAVVIIDEAQDLSLEALEMVRLLSNLETETHKLLQLILVGQPELEDKLNRQDLRQLRQRIQIRHKLRPLNPDETKAYVLHRLKTAAPGCCLVFEANALKKIHDYTSGIPRLINSLCELSLMAAYTSETHVITRRIVRTAFDEMSDKSWSHAVPFWRRWRSHVAPS